MTFFSMAGGTRAMVSSESLSLGPTIASRRSWLGTGIPKSVRAAAIPSDIPPAGSTRVPSRSKITGTVVEVTGLVSHDSTPAQIHMPFVEYFRPAAGSPPPCRAADRTPRPLRQDFSQERGRVALLRLGKLLRRARRHDPPAAGTAVRTEVHDPVRALDDVQVVFDGDHGVALVHEALQHHEQLADVLEVQAGGRLVQHVDAAPVRALLELGGQ